MSMLASFRPFPKSPPNSNSAHFRRMNSKGIAPVHEFDPHVRWHIVEGRYLIGARTPSEELPGPYPWMLRVSPYGFFHGAPSKTLFERDDAVDTQGSLSTKHLYTHLPNSSFLHPNPLCDKISEGR